MDISRATEIDLDGIMELQTANQPERGGTLSASLPRSRISKMMRAMPLIVARCSGRITEERGKGLAQAMFAELQRLLPEREGILFIRRDNSASLRAHAKMGMHEVAGFVFDGNDYVALSYVGPPRSYRRTES